MIEAMPIEKAKEIAALANEQFNALPPETLAAYWRAAANALAGNVVFSLKYLRASGGGMMMNMTTGKLRPWQDDFMDSLEVVGVIMDRPAFFESKKGAK